MPHVERCFTVSVNYGCQTIRQFSLLFYFLKVPMCQSWCFWFYFFLVWCDLVFFSNTCTHSHFRHTHTTHRAQHFIVNVGAPEGRDQSKHTCISHKNGTKPFSGRSEVVEVGLEVSLPVVDVEGKLRRNYTRWFSKCFYKEYPICCHLQVNLTLSHLSIITLRRKTEDLTNYGETTSLQPSSVLDNPLIH